MTTKEQAPKPAPRRPTVERSLSSLAREDVDIQVQNQLNSITVFTRKNGGDVEVLEFQPKDDPNGEDIYQVSSEYLRLPRFLDALKKGILKIVDADDPAVVEAADKQRAAWDAQQTAKNESDQFIDSQQVKAFSGKQCLAQEGRLRCSEFALFASNNSERPPLCQKHAYLAGQFVPEETGKFTNGKPEVEWRQVGIVQ